MPRSHCALCRRTGRKSLRATSVAFAAAARAAPSCQLAMAMLLLASRFSPLFLGRSLSRPGCAEGLVAAASSCADVSGEASGKLNLRLAGWPVKRQ